MVLCLPLETKTTYNFRVRPDNVVAIIDSEYQLIDTSLHLQLSYYVPSFKASFLRITQQKWTVTVSTYDTCEFTGWGKYLVYYGSKVHSLPRENCRAHTRCRLPTISFRKTNLQFTSLGKNRMFSV